MTSSVHSHSLDINIWEYHHRSSSTDLSDHDWLQDIEYQQTYKQTHLQPACITVETNDLIPALLLKCIMTLYVTIL